MTHRAAATSWDPPDEGRLVICYFPLVRRLKTYNPTTAGANRNAVAGNGTGGTEGTLPRSIAVLLEESGAAEQLSRQAFATDLIDDSFASRETLSSSLGVCCRESQSDIGGLFRGARWHRDLSCGAALLDGTQSLGLSSEGKEQFAHGFVCTGGDLLLGGKSYAQRDLIGGLITDDNDQSVCWICPAHQIQQCRLGLAR